MTKQTTDRPVRTVTFGVIFTIFGSVFLFHIAAIIIYCRIRDAFS